MSTNYPAAQCGVRYRLCQADLLRLTSKGPDMYNWVVRGMKQSPQHSVVTMVMLHGHVLSLFTKNAADSYILQTALQKQTPEFLSLSPESKLVGLLQNEIRLRVDHYDLLVYGKDKIRLENTARQELETCLKLPPGSVSCPTFFNRDKVHFIIHDLRTASLIRDATANFTTHVNFNGAAHRITPWPQGMSPDLCYNCSELNHHASECSNEQACPRCSAGHLIGDCQVDPSIKLSLACPNCVRLNASLPENEPRVKITHEASNMKLCHTKASKEQREKTAALQAKIDARELNWMVSMNALYPPAKSPGKRAATAFEQPTLLETNKRQARGPRNTNKQARQITQVSPMPTSAREGVIPQTGGIDQQSAEQAQVEQGSSGIPCLSYFDVTPITSASASPTSERGDANEIHEDVTDVTPITSPSASPTPGSGDANEIHEDVTTDGTSDSNNADGASEMGAVSSTDIVTSTCNSESNTANHTSALPSLAPLGPVRERISPLVFPDASKRLARFYLRPLPPGMSWNLL